MLFNTEHMKAITVNCKFFLCLICKHKCTCILQYGTGSSFAIIIGFTIWPDLPKFIIPNNYKNILRYISDMFSLLRSFPMHSFVTPPSSTKSWRKLVDVCI